MWLGAKDLKEENKTVDVGNDVHLNIGEKKLTLGEVSLEMWGYAAINIMLELVSRNEIPEQSITRLHEICAIYLSTSIKLYVAKCNFVRP